MPIKNYADFDVLIEKFEGSYRVSIVNSPDGQASTRFEFPFSDAELEHFIMKVGQTRRNVRHLGSPQMEAAKTFGTRLFHSVFKSDIFRCLQNSLTEVKRINKVEGTNSGLRIRIGLSNAPELIGIPWEYLYNPTTDSFFSLSVDTPIIRYLDSADSIEPLAIKPPLHILVMIASPKDYPPLDTEREWLNLNHSIAKLIKNGLITLERIEMPTLAALEDQVWRKEYHIFHFIGHGGFDQQSNDGVLVFEDGYKGPRKVKGRYLGMVLHDIKTLRLAVLNTCEGGRTSRMDPFAGVGQSLLQRGIPAVIAMQFEITDTTALTLSDMFYTALAEGYPVDAALARARRAIFATDNDVEWGTPVLYMRSPNGYLFDLVTLPPSTLSSPSPTTVIDERISQGADDRYQQPGGEEEQTAQPDELYNQALEAFYTDQWERTVELLEQISGQDANYPNARKMREEAKRNQKITSAYRIGSAAYASQSWTTAIEHFEAVIALDPAYVDTAILLKAAKLANLYAAARQYYARQAWQAVVGVFAQISSLDEGYPDPEGLLPLANAAIARETREQRLLSLYNHGLRHIDSGGWAQALTDFDELQKIMPTYRNVAELRERVVRELKILTEEQGRKDQLAFLYAAGVQSMEAGDLPMAAKYFAEIEQLQPNYRETAALLTLVQEQIKTFISQLREALLGALVEPEHTEIPNERVRLTLDNVLQIKGLLSFPHNNAVIAVAFSPDGQTFAAGCNDGNILLWRVSGGTPLRTMDAHKIAKTAKSDKVVYDVAFSPDGQHLASAGFDKTVRLWQVVNGQLLRTFNHAAQVLKVVFAPDGQTIASGDAEGTVQVWGVADGQILYTISGLNAEVHGLAFSPDGRTLFVHSLKGAILWQAPNIRYLLALDEPFNWLGIKTVAYRSDRELVAWAVVAGDKYICLGNKSDSLQKHVLHGHKDRVFCVAMSSDGTLIASGSSDKTVQLWGIPKA